MTLSKVGTSAGDAVYGLSEGNTLTVTFTADSTFQENDFLVFYHASGARSAGLLYAHAQGRFPGTYTDNTFTTDWIGVGWGYGGVVTQQYPYWCMTIHWVTAAEAGSATIDCVITLGETGTPGNGFGWILAMGGVAIRGAQPCQHGNLPLTAELHDLYIPTETNDADNFRHLTSSSPQSESFVNVASDTYIDESSGGTLLFYFHMGSGFEDDLLTSTVSWTGPTEIDDAFYQDLITSTTPDYDVHWGSAYRIVDIGQDWPSDTVTHTWTISGAGPHNTGGFRTAISFDVGVPIIESWTVLAAADVPGCV